MASEKVWREEREDIERGKRERKDDIRKANAKYNYFVGAVFTNRLPVGSYMVECEEDEHQDRLEALCSSQWRTEHISRMGKSVD